jgi:hypothetical protein
VGHVVFAQTGDGQLPLVQLLHNARRFFAVSLDVLEAEGSRARIAVELPGGARARFSVTTGAVTPELLARAERAEIAGRAAGMASLAARCKLVWRVEPEGEASDAALFTLCAVLASVALGPVLPPDDSTLFGVRGALRRVPQNP